jgi:outer membrane biosynthesis protein TonB
MAKPRSRKFRHLPVIAFAFLATFLGVAVLSYIRELISGAPTPTKKVVQEIHVIRPPTPPPDEPPPPPPPEEKVNVPDPQNKPDPTPTNEPPPSEHLGLDTEGTAGGDGFGLVGNQGGRELIGSGGGNAYAWCAGQLKDEIMDSLQTENEARSGNYSATVRVWVRGGAIERVRVEQSSGDRRRDQVLEAAISRTNRLPQACPADMPQSISLRIQSRG